VDCGPDVILIEVASGRFTLPILIEGDPEKAAADLTRLLFKKLDQLGRRIDDLLAGEWAPPDVELDRVERIWPVVVTADMLQNDLLWQEIKHRLPKRLGRARVQQLTLLDLPDVELLGALVDQGFGLRDLLAVRRAARMPRWTPAGSATTARISCTRFGSRRSKSAGYRQWCGLLSFSASTRTRRRSGGTPRSRRPRTPAALARRPVTRVVGWRQAERV